MDETCSASRDRGRAGRQEMAGREVFWREEMFGCCQKVREALPARLFR